MRIRLKRKLRKDVDDNKKATIYTEEPVIGPYQAYLPTKDKPQEGTKERKRKTCILLYVNVCPPMLYLYQASQVSSGEITSDYIILVQIWMIKF